MAGWLLAIGLCAWPAFAQEASSPAKQAAKSRGGDSIAERLGRLEEKVQSLQVTIGTLQSFAGSKSVPLSIEKDPGPAQSGAQADLLPRIQALETQISALTRHIEQIGRQMTALETKLSALPEEPARAARGSAPPPQDGLVPMGDDSAATASIGNGEGPKPRWYGPKPGSDAFDDLLEREAASGASQAASDNAPQNLTATLTGSDAQTLYQQGYGALLQKDYAGAEAAFRELVERHPGDPLAGDAQYWIGETYFVRGQYKKAADAFLSGYKKFKSAQKAPDTLLKLGMSLAELGQKSAACSTFDELKTKYPDAPPHIGGEARTWRDKTGC